MDEIEWSEFEKVELRIGTVLRAEPFPEARKPAIKLWVDFGAEIGEKQSSAQITQHYEPEALIGKQVVGVVNFPPKRIAGFKSEFLLTGFYDENDHVVLAVPDKAVPNGRKLA